MKLFHKTCAVLTAALLLTASCATAQETPGYTPGTYTGVSMNGRGGKLTVVVETQADRIASISVGEHAETPGISDPAIASIPADVVTYQSLAVDAVTGATITSNAILEAVADAVAQAGGDVEALKANTFEKELSTDIIELETDLVVAGAGGAGLAAAVAACDFGAESVIVFEKAASIGGNTLISAGLVSIPAVEECLKPYRAANTPFYTQYLEDFVAAGPQSEEEAQYWNDFVTGYEAWKSGNENDKVYDSYVFDGILTLRSYGVPIASKMQGRYDLAEYLNWFLNKTGIEMDTQISITGFPWPNFTPIKGAVGGNGWIQGLQNVIMEQNEPVEIYLNTPVTELLMDDAGKVTGVKAVANTGETYMVTAKRGVILATGGFGANSEMIHTYNTLVETLPDDVPTDNCAGDTGDGMIMAQKAGAALVNMSNVQWMPVASAIEHGTATIVGNVNSMFLVNKEGVRFVDESITRESICAAIFQQTDGMAYMISDAENSGIVDGVNTYGVSEESLLERNLLIRAETIAELNEKMGLKPGTMEATIAQFNAAVQTGNDELLGRKLFVEGSDINTEEGPYYAYPIAPAVHITFGGISVDEHLRALDAEGNPIEGLYAAGEVTDSLAGISGAMTDGYQAAKAIFGKE